MTGFQILAADAADGGVTADGAGERTIGDGTGVASTCLLYTSSAPAACDLPVESCR